MPVDVTADFCYCLQRNCFENPSQCYGESDWLRDEPFKITVIYQKLASTVVF